METADKIGLLTGFGWIAGHGFIVTLTICWLLTPVLHCLIGLVLESRWVPLRPSEQFLSFFPGDLFLGVMAAGLLVLAQRLPSQNMWYNSPVWHTFVLLIALAIASAMTFTEWKSGVYPTRAILSPTKLYHNLVLYVGYGYVIVTTLLANILGAPDVTHLLILTLMSGGAWAVLVVRDNSLGSTASKAKASNAHVADWKPIWK